MSGLDMLAGVGGFMEGYRFGRELMGDDPESRKMRADREALAAKHSQDQRKASLDTARFGLDVEKANADRDYKDRMLEGQAQNRSINQQNADTNSRSVDLRARKEQRDAADFADEQAFKTNARNQAGAFTAVMNGNPTPEQQRIFDVLAPFVTQDAQQSRAQLGQVVNTASQLHREGRVREADAVFSTPEGQTAINNSFGPLIAQQKGAPLDADGNFVIGDTRGVGVVRDAKSNDLALQLEVTRVPSARYAEALRREFESATPERKQQIQAELQPKQYTSLLTQGRTPLDQGGEVRWFTPEDFQNYAGSINRLAYLQQQHPEMFDDIRRYVESNVAAKNEQEGSKLYLQRADAAARDKETRLEQQRDNARQDQKTILQGVDAALNNRMPPWTEGDETAAAKRLHVSNVRTKAYDAILSGKAKSVDEAIKMAEAGTVAPMADRISGLLAGRGVSQTQHAPEVRDIGEKLKRGEITREQAVQEWARLGVR